MMVASGFASRTRSVILTNWLAASGADRTLRAMPPTSLLCVMSWLRILMATGKPISSAALAHSSAVLATIVLTARIWYASSTSLASGSLRMLRPSRATSRKIFLTASRSGSNSGRMSAGVS